MKRVVNKIYRPTNKLTQAKYKHLLLFGLLLALPAATARPGLTLSADTSTGDSTTAAATSTQVPGVLYGWGSGWPGNGTKSTASGRVGWLKELPSR